MSEAEKPGRMDRAGRMLELATKHFAVFSALTIFVGAIVAVVFISAYLRVFDWRLIWIIEYGDVLKIGLVTIALFAGFSFFIWSSAQSAFELKKTGRTWMYVNLFAIGMWLLSFGMSLYDDYYSSEPKWGLHFSLHFSILAIVCLAVVISNAYRDFDKMDASQIMWLIFVAVANVSTLGTAFGYYTRDTSGFHHDIFLKDKVELRDVGVVMVTSHHVVLFTKDKKIITVPAGDLVRLEQKK